MNQSSGTKDPNSLAQMISLCYFHAIFNKSNHEHSSFVVFLFIVFLIHFNFTVASLVPFSSYVHYLNLHAKKRPQKSHLKVDNRHDIPILIAIS